MFKNAVSFNGSISSWHNTVPDDATQTQDMTSMFEGATTFNPIDNDDGSRNAKQEFNTNRFAKTDSMFKDAISFNGDITGWNPAKVTSMANMFKNAVNFNQDINSDIIIVDGSIINLWRTSKVVDFSGMFQGATKFNQDLNNWAVDAALKLPDMFNGATNFNHKLCNWRNHNTFPTNIDMITKDMFKNSNCADKNDPTATVVCQAC